MDITTELTNHIDGLIKEAEKGREATTEIKQDWYYTGYLDALSDVLKFIREL